MPHLRALYNTRGISVARTINATCSCGWPSLRYRGLLKGGLLPTEMPRLKQLEEENSKLRKVVGDLSLDKEMLQDVIRQL